MAGIPSLRTESAQAGNIPPATSEIFEQEEQLHIRAFVCKLLEAFIAADEYAKERFNIPQESDRSRNWDTFFRVSGQDLGSSVYLERNLRQLYSIHRSCIQAVADKLSRLLLNDVRLNFATRRARIQAALAESSSGNVGSPVNIPETFRTLQHAAERFRKQHGGFTKDDSASMWTPDWRTQNVVWTLIKKMGAIVPPPIFQIPFQELKEASFSCLFEHDFIDKQWMRCTFRETLMRYFPRPNHWDADLSWVGVSFFVSLPLTGYVNSFKTLNLEIRLYWGLVCAIFFCTAIGTILFYAAYRSYYSMNLMKRAARGTRYEKQYCMSLQVNKDRLHAMHVDLGFGYSTSSSVGNSAVSDSLDAAELATDSTATRSAVLPEGIMSEEALGIEGNTMQTIYGSSHDSEGSGSDVPAAMSPSRAIGFLDKDSADNSGATLRLYQAAMFVQRIYGSTYFDESWAFGLSEDQLLNAIKLMLGTDSSLGRQYAAFSFAAIAISSRGVPSASGSSSGSSTVTLTFSFAVFSFLAALTFVCGLTSAVLADLILRQMSFTQISREGTAHGFSQRFGFFIRVVGGLNSLAGTILGTAVLHFLLAIFNVHPAAVIPLGLGWLFLGSMLSESFFSNYHFWRMSEILDDVTLIAEPDVRSPSPITGMAQFAMFTLRKIFQRRRRRSSKQENRTSGGP